MLPGKKSNTKSDFGNFALRASRSAISRSLRVLFSVGLLAFPSISEAQIQQDVVTGEYQVLRLDCSVNATLTSKEISGALVCTHKEDHSPARTQIFDAEPSEISTAHVSGHFLFVRCKSEHPNCISVREIAQGRFETSTKRSGLAVQVAGIGR